MERNKKCIPAQFPACVLKIAFFMAHVAIAAACSGDSDDTTPDSKQRAVSFGIGEKTEEVTRAGASKSMEEAGIASLTVYGYKTVGGTMQNVMPGYTLTHTAGSAGSSTTNSSDWEYVGQGTDYLGLAQEIKYWDGNSSDYRFFGVLPAYKDNLKYDGNDVGTGSGEAFESEKAPATGGNFTLNLDMDYLTLHSDGKYKDKDGNEVEEKDIPMYGALWQGDPSANSGQPVTLQFVKPYALVSLVFMRPEGTSTTVLGKEGDSAHPTTFAPMTTGATMAGSGTATVTYPMTGSTETVAVAAGTETLQSMTVSPVTLTDQDLHYQTWPEYLMIPTSANGDFKCTTYIYIKKGTVETFYERTAVIPAAYMQWRAGHKYTYVFKITMSSSLEFSHVIETYIRWQAGYSDHTQW